MNKQIIKKYGNEIKYTLPREVTDHAKDLTGYMVYQWAKHYPSMDDVDLVSKEFIKNRVDLFKKELSYTTLWNGSVPMELLNVSIDIQKVFDILEYGVEDFAIEIFEYNDEMWKDYLFNNGYETEFNEPEDQEYTWEENAVAEHGDDLHIVCSNILRENFGILDLPATKKTVSKLKVGTIGMIVELLAGYRTDKLPVGYKKTPEQELLEMVENKIWELIKIEFEKERDS